jgi:hypothetical protein
LFSTPAPSTNRQILLWQLKSLQKVVQTLEGQRETVPKEDKEKCALIKKKIQQAKLEVANTLLVH